MSPDDLFKRLRKRKPKPAGAPSGTPEQASEAAPEASQERAVERPAKEKRRPAQTVAQRQRQLAESFLDNEALTENLDDQAARALIDWSMDLARRVAESTQDLPDEQAEVQVAQRGEAARRLIRAARDLAVASTNAGDIQAARGALPALPAPDTDPAQPETQAETPAAETSRAVPGPDRSDEAVQQVARHAQEVYGSSVQADQPEALQDRLRQAGAAPVERIAALRAFLESGAADQHLPFWHDDEKDRDW